MIEIVKHGDSTLSCECPECGCEFRFSPRDMLFDYSEDTRMAEFNYVVCPECGKDVRETWDGHALPDEWKKYEKRRKERWGV